MAFLFSDSFDHYLNAEIAAKWTGNFAAAPTLTAGQGRFGAGIVENSGGTANGGYYKTLTAQPTWIIGAAFLFTNIAASGGILGLYDAGSIQVDARMTASGTMTVTRNGTVLATSTQVMSTGVWHFIELKATINNAGSFELRVDGVTWASGSADTQNTANATADQVVIRVRGNSVSTRIDDFYACDGTGGAPHNDFLGDVRVEALFPNGNGNSSVFVGSDGNSVDNYLLVDDPTQDGDTTYVQGSSVGDKDTYAYGALTPTTGTVYGVQVLMYARKTDAGARSIASIARHSGSEVDSSNQALSTSYQYLVDVRETKPGGGAWTISDVNGAEFGAKVTV